MKKLVAFVVLFAIALPVLAQVRRPVPPPRGPGSPRPIPPRGPGYPIPPRGPGYPAPLPPSHQCVGSRYQAAMNATRNAALDRLYRFEIEKQVNCSLQSSGFDFAIGRCFHVTGRPYATLNMSFSVNCHSRYVTSRLIRTNIRYDRR